MKNTKTHIACLAFAVLSVFSFGFTNSATVAPLDKITICHMPPGNHDNCHEITISYNAFQTHIDHHGDALVCHDPKDLAAYTQISDTYQMSMIKAF